MVCKIADEFETCSIFGRMWMVLVWETMAKLHEAIKFSPTNYFQRSTLVNVI